MRLIIVLTIVLAGLLSASCLGVQSMTAWNGIQQARTEAGAPALEWDAEMYPFVAERARDVSADLVWHCTVTPCIVHSRGHEGWYNAGMRFLEAIGETPEEINVSEMLVWTHVTKPADDALRAWQGSPAHWAGALDPIFHRAAIAEYESGGLITIVMWLRD